MNKKIFEAQLTVKMYDPHPKNPIPSEQEFASADGITGVVIFENVDFDGHKSFTLNVKVLSKHKRTYPNFEAYLNLIQTVISHYSHQSVQSLLDIKTKVCHTQADDLTEVETYKNLVLFQDSDNDYIIRTRHNYLNLACFSELTEAEQYIYAYFADESDYFKD